ncbi:hypothetical protein M758_10G076500 [Ceratodon purpureus]|nr:hypothetical protein M758_10G076500 [Ceratodon purpureus]
MAVELSVTSVLVGNPFLHVMSYRSFLLWAASLRNWTGDMVPQEISLVSKWIWKIEQKAGDAYNCYPNTDLCCRNYVSNIEILHVVTPVANKEACLSCFAECTSVL